MADPALIQQANDGGSVKSPYVVTLPALPTAGNALILAIGVSGLGPVTVSSVSGGGVTWVQAKRQVQGTSVAEIWYGLNASGAAGTDVITVTYSAAVNGNATVSEWSNITTDSGLILDGTPGGVSESSGTPLNVGSVTNSHAKDLIVAAGAIASGSATITSWSDGYTALSSASNRGQGAYKVVSTRGSQTTAGTHTGTGNPLKAGCIVAFRSTDTLVEATSVRSAIRVLSATLAILAVMQGTARASERVDGGTLNTTRVSGRHLTHGADDVDATSYSTAVISPSPNHLILVAVSSGVPSGTVNYPTLTGCGLTWEVVRQLRWSDGFKQITLFRSMGANPTPGALTFDFAGQSQGVCAWSVDEFGDVDTSGTNGSGAVIQSVTGSLDDAGTSLSISLAPLQHHSASYGALRTYPNRATISPGSGYSELGEAAATNLSVQTEWRTDGQTAVDWSFTSSAFGDLEGIAVEIKSAFTSTLSGRIRSTERLYAPLSVSIELIGKSRHSARLSGAALTSAIPVAGYIRSAERLEGAGLFSTIPVVGTIRTSERLKGASLASTTAIVGYIRSSERLNGGQLLSDLPVVGYIRSTSRVVGTGSVGVIFSGVVRSSERLQGTLTQTQALTGVTRSSTRLTGNIIFPAILEGRVCASGRTKGAALTSGLTLIGKIRVTGRLFRVQTPDVDLGDTVYPHECWTGITPLYDGCR